MVHESRIYYAVKDIEIEPPQKRQKNPVSSSWCLHPERPTLRPVKRAPEKAGGCLRPSSSGLRKFLAAVTRVVCVAAVGVSILLKV